MLAFPWATNPSVPFSKDACFDNAGTLGSSDAPADGCGPSDSPAPADGCGFEDWPAPDDGCGFEDWLAPDDGCGFEDWLTPDDGCGFEDSPTPDDGCGLEDSPTSDDGCGFEDSPTPADGCGPSDSPAPDDGCGASDPPTPGDCCGFADPSVPDGGCVDAPVFPLPFGACDTPASGAVWPPFDTFELAGAVDFFTLTVTRHTNFFFPNLAVILAFPFFLAFTFPLEETVAIFLLLLFHFTFLPAPLTLSRTLFPTYKVTFFLFSFGFLTFFAIACSGEKNIVSVKARQSTSDIHFLFIVSILSFILGMPQRRHTQAKKRCG